MCDKGDEDDIYDSIYDVTPPIESAAHERVIDSSRKHEFCEHGLNKTLPGPSVGQLRLRIYATLSSVSPLVIPWARKVSIN